MSTAWQQAVRAACPQRSFAAYPRVEESTLEAVRKLPKPTEPVCNAALHAVDSVYLATYLDSPTADATADAARAESRAT